MEDQIVSTVGGAITFVVLLVARIIYTQVIKTTTLRFIETLDGSIIASARVGLWPKRWVRIAHLAKWYQGAEHAINFSTVGTAVSEAKQALSRVGVSLLDDVTVEVKASDAKEAAIRGAFAA